MAHRSARLTPRGRLELVLRVVRDGWPVARVAEGSVVSRQSVHIWVRRYRELGLAGLKDRSSRPTIRWGPDRLAAALKLPASTVYAVLRRHYGSRLTDFDRPTRKPIRYQRQRAGELIHLDVKKLGRIPDGGGKRMAGREHGRAASSQLGNDYLHVAVDDATRLAFVRVYSDETGVTCARFLIEASNFFARHQIQVEAVMTDNAKAYAVSRKAERFIRILINEWAYGRLYRSNQLRLDQLPRWLHFYNSRRHHTALGGSPMAAVKKVLGDYS